MKEIIKSPIMMTFIIVFLGLITINSIAEKKDLERTNETSQIIYKK